MLQIGWKQDYWQREDPDGSFIKDLVIPRLMKILSGEKVPIPPLPDVPEDERGPPWVNELIKSLMN